MHTQRATDVFGARPCLERHTQTCDVHTDACPRYLYLLVFADVSVLQRMVTLTTVISNSMVSPQTRSPRYVKPSMVAAYTVFSCAIPNSLTCSRSTSVSRLMALAWELFELRCIAWISSACSP